MKEKGLRWLFWGVLGSVIALELRAPIISRSWGVDGPALDYLERSFSKLFAAGALFPRWNPSGFSGFGAPSFYFYPPLCFYLGGILRAVTGLSDSRALFEITSVVATIGSVLTSYYFFRKINGSHYQSLIASLLYGFGAYRIAELYNRSSLSSHFGYIFLPLVWLGLMLIVLQREERIQRILLFSVSLALMTLSSVPLTILTAFCAIVAAIPGWRYISKRAVVEMIIALGLTALLCVFHFGTSYSASGLVQLQNLKPAPQNLFADLLHGINLPTIYHSVILDIPILVAALVLWKRRDHLTEKESIAIKIGMAVAIFILVLQIPFLSAWAWDKVVPLQLTIDTERYLIQLLLLGSVIIAVASSSALRPATKYITWILVIAAIGPAILVGFDIHFFHHTEFVEGDPKEYLPVTVPYKSEAQLREAGLSDSLFVGNFQNGDDLEITETLPRSQTLNVRLKNSLPITFHRFYWSYWHLNAKGMEITTRSDDVGRAVAQLPAGDYTAEWKLERTPLESAGLWISGFAWSGVIITSGIGLVRRRVKRKRATSSV